jgi:hypothetical protein
MCWFEAPDDAVGRSLMTLFDLVSAVALRSDRLNGQQVSSVADA